MGGGFAGLLAAKLLTRNSIAFIGLEKSDFLGGHTRVGHHRFYDEGATSFLSQHLNGVEWLRIDDTPKERRKGEWRDIEEECTEEEQFYLKAPYFHPQTACSQLTQRLIEEVGGSFLTKKSADKIDPEKKVLTCVDGTEFSYDTILWCADMEFLSKAWPGDKTAVLKALKGQKEVCGGLNLDMELGAPMFSLRNTVVFPFRHKDKKLRALGVHEPGSSEKANMHWLMFLEEAIAEDREEVAKCVRALKRELQKEFPELKENTKNERIVYLSSLSGNTPSPVKSLTVLPGIIYLGPQARPPGSNEELRNLDRIVDNCRRFEDSLKGLTT